MNGNCATWLFSCAHSAAFHNSDTSTTRSSETSSAATAPDIGFAISAWMADAVAEAAAAKAEADTGAEAVEDAEAVAVAVAVAVAEVEAKVVKEADDGAKANGAAAESGDAFGRDSESAATIERPMSVKRKERKACSGAGAVAVAAAAEEDDVTNCV